MEENKTTIRSLHDLSHSELKNKRVVVRVSANVPVVNGVIQDSKRLESSMETIRYLQDAGAVVILIGHIWGGEIKTLEPVYEWLKERIAIEFIADGNLENVAERIKLLGAGDVVLLENIRLHPGEMSNDDGLSRKLAGLGDLYVNDSFPDSHRSHASIVGIPRFIPGVMGFNFEMEVRELSKAFDPDHPFLLVVGGAKFSTKIPLIHSFSEIADTMFIGGAIMNVFLSAEGCEIGTSLLPKERIELNTDEFEEKIYLPRDVISLSGGHRYTRTCDTLGLEDRIMDIGPEALDDLIAIAKESKFVVWNGPLGNYEEGYVETTEIFARELSKMDAKTIIGGGDTSAVISRFGIEDTFTFVSTGGGAMLEFLTHHTLPGIDALRRS